MKMRLCLCFKGVHTSKRAQRTASNHFLTKTQRRCRPAPQNAATSSNSPLTSLGVDGLCASSMAATRLTTARHATNSCLMAPTTSAAGITVAHGETLIRLARTTCSIRRDTMAGRGLRMPWSSASKTRSNQQSAAASSLRPIPSPAQVGPCAWWKVPTPRTTIHNATS